MSRHPLDPKHLPPAAWYDAWWQPPDLLALVQTHNTSVPEVDFFRQPKLKPLREAFAAAMFATIRTQSAACMIRLTLPEQEFPDFWLQLPGEIQPFELTEADREGRRRGDEYYQAAERASAGLPRQWKGYDPDEEAEAIVPLVAKRIRQKAAKRYHPPPHLLVYVNSPLHRELRLTDQQAVDLAMPWQARFASIWLLWGGNAVRCFPNPAKIVLRDVPPGVF